MKIECALLWKIKVQFTLKDLVGECPSPVEANTLQHPQDLKP